jgi:hypothetical protein
MIDYVTNGTKLASTEHNNNYKTSEFKVFYCCFVGCSECLEGMARKGFLEINRRAATWRIRILATFKKAPAPIYTPLNFRSNFTHLTEFSTKSNIVYGILRVCLFVLGLFRRLWFVCYFRQVWVICGK